MNRREFATLVGGAIGGQFLLAAKTEGSEKFLPQKIEPKSPVSFSHFFMRHLIVNHKGDVVLDGENCHGEKFGVYKHFVSRSITPISGLIRGEYRHYPCFFLSPVVRQDVRDTLTGESLGFREYDLSNPRIKLIRFLGIGESYERLRGVRYFARQGERWVEL